MNKKMTQNPEIETLESKIVYANKWISVREDKIRRPSGAEGIYSVVDKPDFVVILPIEDEFIHLVQQFRYPVGKRYWELPQGTWEEKPTADHLALATGELEEETGLTAAKMEYIGYQYLAYGLSSQGYHIYLASGFQKTQQRLDAEEEGLITQKFRLDTFESMIKKGEIKDATSVNAFGLARLKGFL